MAYRAGLPLVLRGVSLQLAPGEKLGVCGRTGAGKSSLLVALFRLAELHAGAIRVDGVDLGAIWRGEGLPPRVLYGESYLPVNAYGWSPLHVAQRGRWKLIEGPDPELYDLERDPTEVKNCFNDPEYAEHVTRLKGRLTDVLAQYGAPAMKPIKPRKKKKK